MIPIQHIHPILVHFPIVFFLTLGVLDMVAVFWGSSITGRTPVGNVSASLAVLAGLSAFAAALMGDEALEFAEANGFSSNIAEIHENLGFATAIVFAVWGVIRAFLWFKKMDLGGAAKWGIVLVEGGGVALIITTAYFGGSLVYDLGVNVTRAIP